ncbi:MAG: hypothetical protein ABH879_06065 [archaeon]
MCMLDDAVNDLGNCGESVENALQRAAVVFLHHVCSEIIGPRQVFTELGNRLAMPEGA